MPAESTKTALGSNSPGDLESVYLSVDSFHSEKGVGIAHELGNCILDYRCCCCKPEQSLPAQYTQKFTSKDTVAIGAETLFYEDPLPSHQAKIIEE